MSQAPTFEMVAGGVRAVDPGSGATLAERGPVGTQVLQIIPVGGGRVVVRENYDLPEGESNVYCLDAALVQVWRAELPDSADVYSGPASLVGGLLRVASWNGWTCDLDPSTGAIVRKRYTK